MGTKIKRIEKSYKKMNILELLPEQYGLVILFNILGVILLEKVYMGFAVGAARKKYGVSYPTLYSDKPEHKVYNCIQRGHQNTMEIAPPFMLLSIIAGLKHPLLVGISGSLFILGRYIYFNGYSTGNPEARVGGGKFYAPGLLIVLGSTVSVIYTLMSSHRIPSLG